MWSRSALTDSKFLSALKRLMATGRLHSGHTNKRTCAYLVAIESPRFGRMLSVFGKGSSADLRYLGDPTQTLGNQPPSDLAPKIAILNNN
jgi:hypothetical protein